MPEGGDRSVAVRLIEGYRFRLVDAGLQHECDVAQLPRSTFGGDKQLPGVASTAMVRVHVHPLDLRDVSRVATDADATDAHLSIAQAALPTRKLAPGGSNSLVVTGVESAPPYSCT